MPSKKKRTDKNKKQRRPRRAFTDKFRVVSLWNFSVDDAQHVIGAYIDDFYDPERLHSTINHFSPMEVEITSASGKALTQSNLSTFLGNALAKDSLFGQT
ncbi:MAG: hypothetical protein OEZ06_00230 [Myxococcales bacterium]|nr:hypothetical protein [Myxococcales bacterium]